MSSLSLSLSSTTTTTLPPLTTDDYTIKVIRSKAINRYCKHRNANFQTFLHLVQYWSTMFSPDTDLLSEVARSGNVELINGLIKGYRGSIHINYKDIMDNACYYGHLDLVRYCYTNNTIKEFGPNSLNCAVIMGHVNIVRFILDQHLDGGQQNLLHKITSSSMERAIERNNGIAMVHFYLYDCTTDQQTIPIDDLCKMATKHSKLDIQQLLDHYKLEQQQQQLLSSSSSSLLK
ncbi:hypothetical protein DFA_02559 [Cavenderia fasciculata]|uniref:Ankyrin repeat-containing protein n=1 Tax=Cavenderia fasciculata TaxID=261658 RepID=F4PZQ6_CACFS|nr:uncharacterized protein DFA_02559 [Cavenderia fasciculata]EGG18820.1 hypothetical protein DFA_02559 [Cavenderia fasciculata]|eukprot:XP_004357282.1 hypothetical protein DFA_02559 [Cavenderia fasciculata]